MVITGRVSSMVENHTLCECVSDVVKNKNGTVISKCGEPLSVTRLGGRGVMRKRLTDNGRLGLQPIIRQEQPIHFHKIDM
jgi:hypothetical protein